MDNVNCNDVVRIEVKCNDKLIQIFEKVCHSQADLNQLLTDVKKVTTRLEVMSSMSNK